MLKILGRIPKTHFHVAVSGGSDSMVLLDFLMKYPNNKFDILHFNHGTNYCDEAEDFVTEFCKKHGIELHIGRIQRNKNKTESMEEYWRNQRYSFFSKFTDEHILMSHHLNDCIETWIMTSLKGNPRIIPYYNAKYNIIRPLLATSKSAIEEWSVRHNVPYVYDGSNSDISMDRNYIRHVMMPNVLRISPGIEKIIKKKVLLEFNGIKI